MFATLVVGVSALVTNLGDTHTASTVKTVTALTGNVGALVDALQTERVSAASVLVDTRATADVRAAELVHYKSLFAATDATAKAYIQHRRSLSGLSEKFEASLTSVDGSLATLVDLRQGTTAGASLPNGVSTRYTTLIGGLLDLRTNAALLTNDAGLAQELQAGAALARFKESLAQVRMRVDAIIVQGQVNTEDIGELLQQDAEQNNYFSTFGTLASSSQRDYYETTTEKGTNSRWKSYEVQATDLTVGSLQFEFPTVMVAWFLARSVNRLAWRPGGNAELTAASRIRRSGEDALPDVGTRGGDLAQLVQEVEHREVDGEPRTRVYAAGPERHDVHEEAPDQVVGGLLRRVTVAMTEVAEAQP